jgi:hypothetical protein
MAKYRRNRLEMQHVALAGFGFDALKCQQVPSQNASDENDKAKSFDWQGKRP